ncbi:unnamed protein product [Linum trigynum]|uniref:TF-B3 domain-containing protein n=1 Tax=Linum trigynum TaxID=586398 RepID=A0AAV2GU77_9ROSI
MTIPVDQLVPAAPAGGGEIPAQCRFVLPCLVPDFSQQIGSDGRRLHRWRLVPLVPNLGGGTTTLRQLIAAAAAGGGSSAANLDSRKRPRMITGKPSKLEISQPPQPESPVSVSEDSGPESEDSEPRKRARRSEEPEPKQAAVAPVPLIIDVDDDDDDEEKEKFPTGLTFSDESRRAGHPDPGRTRLAPAKQSESETWRKLTRMRNYTREDDEEEREKGVSTKLQLYEDPWTIRQRVKMIEAEDPNPMLALHANAGRYVAGLLTKEDLARLVNDGRPVRVRIWDVDTESEHEAELVRRRLWFGSGMHWVIGFAGDWWSEFVRRRGLEEGDEIGMNWDRRHFRFNFRLIAQAAGGN